MDKGGEKIFWPISEELLSHHFTWSCNRHRSLFTRCSHHLVNCQHKHNCNLYIRGFLPFLL